MKNYSNSAVSKEDVIELASGIAAREALSAALLVDAKQDRQINQLRWALGLAFALNVVLTLALTIL